MKRAGLLLVLLSLTACSLYEPYVVQTSPIGKVTAASGYPEVMRNARPYMLDEQSLLFLGDILTTDEQSLVQVSLDTGVVIETGTRTQLRFGETGEEHRLTLTAGSAEIYDTQSVNEFQITTNFARIVSNSGHVWVGYLTSGNGIEVVSLSDAPVTVSNDDGSVVLTAPMQVTSLRPAAAPQQAGYWSAQRFDRTKLQYTNTRR